MSSIYENYNNILIKKYNENLKLHLNKIHNSNYNSYFESIENQTIDTENQSSVIYSDNNITETEEYYKKSWNKLNIIHKKIKIKEFINNLPINKESKKIIIGKLLNLLNNKKINKNKDIEYDNINGKIISIPLLKCKNDKYYI